jgi:PAS domain S-box-containing protein
MATQLIANINFVDLVIFDILFDNVNLNRLENVLKAIHGKSPTSFLIFTNDKDFDEVKFKEINAKYPDIVYDFFNQHIFREFIFINRTKALLSIPKLSKSFLMQKEAVQNNLWMALDYSSLFVLILNKQFQVVLANYQLARTVGYNNEDEMIGIDWCKHLVPADIDIIQHVHEDTLAGSKKYEEFTNDIVTKEGKRITVKWFNTMINNAFNSTFSIGVPLTKEISIDDNIETVRSYFTDILRKDSTTIQAMKEVTQKYSSKLLSSRNEKGEKK